MGERVEVSLLAAALAVQIQDLVWLEGEASEGPIAATATDLAARADEIATGLATNPYYRCYEASDGFLAVACLNHGQRAAFADLLGLDDPTIAAPDLLPDDPAIVAVKRAVTTQAERALLVEPIATWLERLGERGIPCGPVHARERVHADPQIRANELLVDVDQPGLGRRHDARPAVHARRLATGARARAAPGRAHRRGPAGGGGVRFGVEPELSLFADSVRGALAGWEAPLEPAFGTWWDDRDDGLAARLVELGWDALWADVELLGPAVAGAIELGRAVAPLSLVDEATLGAPLALGDRVRHGTGASVAAVVAEGERLPLVPVDSDTMEQEPTLDGLGTLRRASPIVGDLVPVEEADARLRAWGAATLGYLAGLADGALALALAHVGSREQFGAPLGSLPVVQGRLAEAALERDALALVAWEAVAADPGLPRTSLAWAGPACREVTAQALQVHGGIGFALEGGIHRQYRRAKAAQVWVDALLAATEL